MKPHIGKLFFGAYCSMSRADQQKLLRIFALVCVVIVCIAGFMVRRAYVHAHHATQQYIDEIRHKRQEMFASQLQTTSRNLQQTATLISREHRVRELFDMTRQAIYDEGGGTGRDRAHAYRKQLLEHLEERWSVVMRDYGLRQLHFYCTPGTISLLRVHAPGKYGDDLTDIRHTVVEAIRTGKPVMGFELGRRYAGLRGVIPLYETQAHDPRGKRVVVGALGVGRNLDAPLEQLVRTTRSNFAVLMRKSLVDHAMWQDVKEDWLAEQPPIHGYVIESTTHPAVRQVMQQQSVERLAAGSGSIVKIQGRYVLVISFEMRDYRGTVNPECEPIGMVLNWAPASEALLQTRDAWKDQAIILGLFVPMFMLALWFILNFATLRLNRIIHAQLADLARSRRMLSHVLDAVPLAVFWKDREGKVIGANRRFAELCGVDDPQQLIDCDDQPILPLNSSNTQQYHRDDQLAWQSERAIHSSFSVARNTDGEMRSIEMTRCKLTDELNRSIGLLCLMEDVTEKQNAEAERKRQLHFLQTLMETMPSPIFLKDLEGHYIGCNHAFEQLVGLARHEFLGLTARQVFSDELAEVYEQADRQLRETHELQNYESCVVRPSGETRHVIFHRACLHDEQGTLSGLVGVVTDITERKRMEQQLSESRKFLNATMNAMSAHLAILDSEGTIVSVNAAWNRFGEDNDSGHPSYEVGTNYIQVCRNSAKRKDPDAQYAATGISRVINGQQQNFYMEYPCHSPKEKRWFQMRVTRFAYQGRPWVLVVHENITERKVTELALRQSEQRFRDITAAAGEYIWECDRSGRYIYLSEVVESVLGIPPHRLLGRTPFELMPAEEADRVEKLFADWIRDGQGFHNLEHASLHADGSLRWQRVSASPVYDDQGVMIGLRGTAMDITERKVAEERAGKAQLQLRDAIEALDAGMVIYDSDEKLVVCNQKYKALYPQLAEIMEPGTPIRSILSHYYRNSNVGNRSGLAEEQWVALELSLNRSSTYEEQVNNRWVRIADRTTTDGGVVSLRTDITSLKESEQALRLARDEARQASQSKSQFLANMSHEIRTPMTGILGYAELLQDPKLSEEERLRYVHTVQRNGEHLLRILNDILDLSKIEAGKMSLDPIPTDLMGIVNEAGSLLSVRARDRGLQFKIETHGRLPKWIITDPVRLRQILMNLVGNAIKFTETGSVTVRVNCKMKSEVRMISQIMIEDTGIGMTEQQIQQLYQPFQQADSSMSRRYGGSGLGLSICKHLAHMLGGDIRVKSSAGMGSRFALIFEHDVPLEAFMEEKSQANSAHEPESASGNVPPIEAMDADILLAEDGPDNRVLIEFILNKAGLNVETAENGKLAYDQAMDRWQQGEPYDVILMDMQMPEMDGYQATGQLRNAGYELPIIALTAHALPSDRQKCLDAGCDNYCSKPVRQADLLKLIAQYVQPEAEQNTTTVDAMDHDTLRRWHDVFTAVGELDHTAGQIDRQLQWAGLRSAIQMLQEQTLSPRARELADQLYALMRQDHADYDQAHALADQSKAMLEELQQDLNRSKSTT